MPSMQPSHQKPSVSRPYSRSPGGLLLPLHATLKGRARWQVLDERGVPEVPRNPSGFAIAHAEGVEQSNLITDLGLDRIGELDVMEVSLSNSTLASRSLRRRLAVGTGSTAPNVLDTTLDAEVQRESSSGAFSNGSDVGSLDTDTNVWRAVVAVTRLATMTADRNLTEFGFAQNTTDDIVIRELFRDGGGSPVTISLLNGKTVKVDHTLTIELPAPAAGNAVTIDVEEYDAGNNLIATTPYDVVHGGSAPSATSSFVLGSQWTTGGGVFLAWNPYFSGGSFVRFAVAKTYSRTPSTWASTDTEPIGNTTAAVATFSGEAYVAGSHQRIYRATFPAGAGNAAWYGFGRTSTYSNDQYRRRGWHVMFVDPVSYTKASTDTLRAGFVSSWARA